MTGARTLQILVLALALAVAAASGAIAQNRSRDVLTYFYEEPKPERLVGYLDEYAIKYADWIAYPPVAGFFAVTFRRYPDWIDRLLPATFNPKTADTIAAAMQLSGRAPVPQALQTRLSKAGHDAQLRSEFANLPTRPEDLRIGTATHLDVLWGAFFASGDTRFVAMILDFYARAADQSHDTAIDITKLTIALVGGKSKETYGEMRRKYDEVTLRRLILATTAQWALISNADQHPIVKGVVESYIAERKSSPSAMGLDVLLHKRKS